MLWRDHYATLGVAPDAGRDEVEAAFRHLCRRYHPDLNPGDTRAAAAFERIENAYRVLIDPERRARYDQEGGPELEHSRVAPAADELRVETTSDSGGSFQELFQSLRDHRRRSQVVSGQDLHASTSVPLRQAERGRHTTVAVRRLVSCDGCGGRGHIEAAVVRPCRRCGGTGTEVFTKGALNVSCTCADCGGDGLRPGEQCDRCHGSGLMRVEEIVSVRVPPGVVAGQVIRLPGAGHSGPRGGPAGDLLLTCKVQPHPLFDRHGPNLLCRVPISIAEAVLGGRVAVPTLEDDAAMLRLPPGTQGGQTFRLRGRGLELPDGRRGDLMVTVEVWIPGVVDEDAKQLIREFARRTPEPPRRPESRVTVRS